MQIKTNGQRNITLDFDAPKKFKLKKDGVEIPYIRTGKNSFRLGRNIDGVLDLEEVIEYPRIVKPMQLQAPQMAFISSEDVGRLNEAVKQMALVNPEDVMAINNAAQKIDSSQMYIAEKQQQLEATQTYIDQQQQRLNETALGIQALETDNSQRLDGAENAILNLAGEISNAQNMAVDGMNTALNKIEEQGILLQAEIDTKADKDELESLKKDFEEKSDRISSAMSNYSGGTAYDTLPQGGEAGQILAKRTDRQGDYVWIDQTPVIVKSETIPTASEKYKGEVYQYVGETGDYTHGYIYECQQNGTSYNWVRLDVQPNTAVWGQITGTLSNQTDLQEALNLKANKSYVDSQDNNLQQQIDAITAASDVTDIVGTYAQLQAYDTSTLPNNSIIKVLQDESRNDETTYYRWVITGGVGAWVLIGEEGPYYTKSETNTLLTAKQDTLVSGTNIKTVNGASLLGGGNLSVAGDINPYISNCITEIPQDIKLELNNGTLTLKAGSKVYVPNGSGVFDEKTISSDISINNLTYNTTYLLFTNADATFLFADYRSSCSSGTTQPSGTWKTWYDTTNNKVKRFGNTEGTVLYEGSLPIAVFTVSNGAISSIDQVFNGFGYIGSTIFVLPGVKGLIPNGRNEDGSLKNIESQFTQVTTTTNEYKYSGYIAITSNYFDLSSSTIYNEKENLNYVQGTNVCRRCLAGKFVKGTNGIVTSLQPKTAFHALDYNDSSTISGWAMPSSRYVDLNLGASGATYTAPANGYFCLDKAGTQNEYIDIRNNTTGLLRSKTTISAPGTESIAVYMPCKKGDEIAVVYTATGTTNRFRFIYAEGEN